jgi:hypothetical protein
LTPSIADKDADNINVDADDVLVGVDVVGLVGVIIRLEIFKNLIVKVSVSASGGSIESFDQQCIME